MFYECTYFYYLDEREVVAKIISLFKLKMRHGIASMPLSEKN